MVGSRVGGLVEAIADGETGFLYPPDDRSEMAERVLDLLDHREQMRDIGARARRRTAELFSRQGSARKLLELYDDCLRDHNEIRANT